MEVKKMRGRFSVGRNKHDNTERREWESECRFE